MGQVNETFIQQAPAAVLDIDQHVACDTGGQRELFLRQALLDPYRTDTGPHPLACPGPRGRAFGVSLVGACRHAPQLLRGRIKSLPY